jgi:hypothetical protein
MALSTPAPRTSRPDDLVDIATACRMLDETPHPTPEPTLRRWIRDSPSTRTWTLPGLRATRTRTMISFSAVLDLHRQHHAAG